MQADRQAILAEIAEILGAIRNDVNTDITMDSMFRSEIGLASIEIVALAGRLQARYGTTVNFAQFVAEIGLQSMQDLRVGLLVDYIAQSQELATG
ncbi:acyl carrier protein [Micromonospora sp. NPDC006766]|uniref:acyl carrier protein n=1 Tax=Micromonospora sp. NPDC006766 TaxID=3154778 RepID=UPI0033F319E7